MRTLLNVSLVIATVLAGVVGVVGQAAGAGPCSARTPSATTGGGVVRLVRGSPTAFDGYGHCTSPTVFFSGRRTTATAAAQNARLASDVD